MVQSMSSLSIGSDPFVNQDFDLLQEKLKVFSQEYSHLEKKLELSSIVVKVVAPVFMSIATICFAYHCYKKGITFVKAILCTTLISSTLFLLFKRNVIFHDYVYNALDRTFFENNLKILLEREQSLSEQIWYFHSGAHATLKISMSQLKLIEPISSYFAKNVRSIEICDVGDCSDLVSSLSIFPLIEKLTLKKASGVLSVAANTSEVPESVSLFESLTHLSLEDSSIQGIKGTFKNLKELDLTETDIPFDSQFVPQLTCLSLAYEEFKLLTYNINKIPAESKNDPKFTLRIESKYTPEEEFYLNELLAAAKIQKCVY
ncbi:MAG: hypothetical protein ACOVOR_02915 [Rhabdochlamydiaceae bacterium]